MLSVIVAMANNNVIGKDNKLIWHLPEDLKRFKRLTTGKTIIMGRKTFESLGKVLPNREHIVFTRNNDFKVDNPMVKVIHDIKEIDEYINSSKEYFVIGGESIYKLLMPYTKKMYITKIHEDFEGDSFFPKFDETKWNILSIEKGIKNESNPYDFEYVIYEKKCL